MRTKPMKGKNRNKVEEKMVKNLDDLAQFEDFKSSLLPQLQKAFLDKRPPKEILELGKAYAAARIALIAALDPSASTALAAAKDLLDRTEGKAVERKQLLHAMAGLKDEELDALLLTAVNEDE